MITRLELRDMDTFTLGRMRKEELGICGSNSNGNGRRRIIGGSASGNSGGPAVRVGVLQLRESVAKQRKEWVGISNLEESQVVDKLAVQCKDWKQASAGNLHFPAAAVSVFSLCRCFCEIGMFVYFALLFVEDQCLS